MRAQRQRGEKTVVEWTKPSGDGRTTILQLTNEGRLSEWTPRFSGESLEARMSEVSRRVPRPKHSNWTLTTAQQWASKHGYTSAPVEIGPVPEWLR